MNDLLPSLVEWAMAHAAIRAVLLTSTRAVPHAPLDALSDYDLILVVTDLRPFQIDRTWVNDFGEPLVIYWDPPRYDPHFGLEFFSNVTQYADGLKIDFTLWPVALFQQIIALPQLPAELDAGYRLLLDKDQLAARLSPPSGRGYQLQLPTQTEFQTLINDFLSDAPYVAKCLWRDELFPAKWCLDYDMKHVYLRQLLEWQVAITHAAGVAAGAVKIGSLGKGLKQYLSPVLWNEIEATFVGANVAENWLALEKTLALFRQVAVTVGDRLGYTYPHEQHKRVLAYVARIKVMRR